MKIIPNTTSIITVTQGDFQYIDEWIKYHHSIGVGLFLIGYNGDKKDFAKLPKYDYVRYYDWSTDKDNSLYSVLNMDNDARFSDWFEENTPIKDMTIMQKMHNQLLHEVLLFYPSVKYCASIDTDEFITLSNNKISITRYLTKVFDKNECSTSIQMRFFNDNNHIYNDNKPVLERFTEEGPYKDCRWDKGMSKVIIYMQHPDVINGKCKMISPHTCIGLNWENILNKDEIYLKHFFTKSLEEWISKFNSSNDKDYNKRFINNIFDKYFEFNQMTDEKIKAIPNLLKKYNVNYDPTKDINKIFVEKYKSLINGQ